MAVGGRQKTSQQPVFNVEPFLSLNLYISLLFIVYLSEENPVLQSKYESVPVSHNRMSL